MIRLKGKSVSRGVTVGKLRFLSEQPPALKRSRIDDPAAELERYKAARELAKAQLGELHRRAEITVGEANAAIFEVHQLMLDDEDFNDSVAGIIGGQSVNAEYAVGVTCDNFRAMFSAMDDEYMRARADDVKDISDRIIRNLTSSGDEPSSEEGTIICADDLTPSQTLRMERSQVSAFVMREGSSQSHTAILARTMGIPAIIGVGSALDDRYSGHEAVVDSTTGELVIDPDEAALDEANRKIAESAEQLRFIESMKGKENVTLDGRRIDLFANIGSLADIGLALENDADGVGLFRSEFLYLGSDGYPSEDRQFAIYKAAAENLAGKPLVIRTLDIGADKRVDYFELPREDNPALGWRAIRICLDRTELFKTQLRALCRAGAYGRILVMLPMIVSGWEIDEARRLLGEVQAQLAANSIAYDPDMKLGIMIETPAAALISDELAEKADFFSIGTNDLTQYTLAADRQNPRLDRFIDPHHPALMKLIGMTVENAHRKGIWCGICGELGADLTLTREFLRMGVDELSMSPGSILRVRGHIRELDLSDGKPRTEHGS